MKGQCSLSVAALTAAFAVLQKTRPENHDDSDGDDGDDGDSEQEEEETEEQGRNREKKVSKLCFA